MSTDVRMRSDEALPTKSISFWPFLRSGPRSLEECIPCSEEALISQCVRYLNNDTEKAAKAFCSNQIEQTQNIQQFLKEGKLQGYYQRYRLDAGTITVVNPSIVTPELWRLFRNVTGIFVSFLLGASITAYKFYLPMRFPTLKDISPMSSLKMVTPVVLALGALGAFVRSYQTWRVLSVYRPLKPETMVSSLDKEYNPCINYFLNKRQKIAEVISKGQLLDCIDENKIIKAATCLTRPETEIMIFKYVEQALKTDSWDSKSRIPDFSTFLWIVHKNQIGHCATWNGLSSMLNERVRKYNDKFNKLAAPNIDLQKPLTESGIQVLEPQASKVYWEMVLGGSDQFNAFEQSILNYLSASTVEESAECLRNMTQLITQKGTVSRGIKWRVAQVLEDPEKAAKLKNTPGFQQWHERLK